MAFTPMKTSNARVTEASKTLMYGHHGFGKTTNIAHMARHYGKAFILSGEGGLKSIANADIDYLPFSSWDGEHDPLKINEFGDPVCSFVGICELMKSEEFRAEEYKVIGIDSLTEASALLMQELKVKHAANKNSFARWDDYGAELLGRVKWIRDLPYHVLVTALAKEEADDNGKVDYWPLLDQAKIAKQLPGIFDNVVCGVRRTASDGNKTKIARFLVTEEVNGWHGKVRDPRRRLEPVERTGDITDLFKRMEMGDTEHEQFLQAMQQHANVIE